MSTKAVQGKLWSIAPQYWAQHFEPWFLPMYKTVLNQLKLNREQSLLDAGCGSGLFSNLAIKTGATVTGIDAAPGLLQVARQRNPKNSFLEEDLEALPFADNSFDVVTGFNSFQYAENFEKALLEAKRVLKPGGRLVIGVWNKPELSEATQVLRSISALLPPPTPRASGTFALSEDGKIETVLRGVNIKLIYKTNVSCPFQYATIGDAVKSFMGTSPAAAAIDHTDNQTVVATITRALQPFHILNDLHFLQNNFLVFIAEK